MDRNDDVERLFSWIKTPDLHYREFAAEREVADAVATWPALRDAVPEPSPSDKHLEPEGGAYEEELLPAERARQVERPAAIFGHHEAPPTAPHPAEPLPPPRDEAHEVPWAEEPPPAATTVVHHEPPPARVQAAPSFVRREPVPPVATPPVPPPPVPHQARAPADQEYRGFEERQETPPAAQSERKDESRSLDAIFSRVAHQPRGAGDAPRQSSGATGLGPVFRRLR
jgi:hypothetical protein